MLGKASAMRSKRRAEDNPGVIGAGAAFAAPVRRWRLLPVTMAAAAALLALKLGGLAVSVSTVLAGDRTSQDEQAAALAAVAPAAGSEVGGSEAAAQKPADATAQPTAAAAASAPPGAADAAASDASAGDFISRSEMDLLQDLSDRRQKLDARAQELDTRERLLLAAEQRIDQKIERLKSLEASIKELVRVHDEKEEAQLQSLVKIYETMKPKEAALILEKLDLPVLLNVVERMKEKKVAGVLAAMNPKIAKDVTNELAVRRQLPADPGANG